MRVLQGQVRERRYQPMLVSSKQERNNATELFCTQDVTVSKEDGTIFIEDSLGYHSVGNPGAVASVTLHLYSPPIQSCNIWLRENGPPSRSDVVHYSEYGEKV